MPRWGPSRHDAASRSEARLAQLTRRFASAGTWRRSWRLLTRHPELMGDEAASVLTRLAGDERRCGDHDAAEAYDYYAAVLRRCRELGPDRVNADLTAVEDDDDLLSLVNAAGAALARYRRHGDPDDLAAAVRDGEEAAARATAVPTKVAALSNLGLALLARADHAGSPGDVVRAVAVPEEAVAITPPHIHERLTYVINLGGALMRRHELDADPASLERAIGPLQRAAQMDAELSDVEGAGLWGNLGMALFTCFSRTGTPADLGSAVDALWRATFTGADDRERAQCLGNLGVALSDRHMRTGDLTDLEQAVAVLDEAVRLTPAGSPERAARIAHLAGAMIERYERTGADDDLDRTALELDEAARITRVGSSDRAAREMRPRHHSCGTVRAHRRLRDLDLDLAVAAHERSAARRRRPAARTCRCVWTSSARAFGYVPSAAVTPTTPSAPRPFRNAPSH
jgi:hypothetical protein